MAGGHPLRFWRAPSCDEAACKTRPAHTLDDKVLKSFAFILPAESEMGCHDVKREVYAMRRFNHAGRDG